MKTFSNFTFHQNSNFIYLQVKIFRPIFWGLFGSFANTNFNEESLDSQITKILSEIYNDEWIKTFEKGLERIQLCIKFKGAYIEHKIKSKPERIFNYNAHVY